MDQPRLPDASNRSVIIGSTGSGKTTAGAWLLSTKATLNYERMPVVMFDWKGDRLINSFDAKEWGLHQRPPTKPGLYIVHPEIDVLEPVDEFLNRCWAQENIGLFFDEAAELEKSRAINRVMKQGRSKHIPCISCTQRPKWLPRSVFSEADFFMLLRLNDMDDRTTVKRFINADVHKRRAELHSIWYDVAKDRANLFGPVIPPAEIRARIKWGSQGERARKVV